MARSDWIDADNRVGYEQNADFSASAKIMIWQMNEQKSLEKSAVSTFLFMVRSISNLLKVRYFLQKIISFNFKFTFYYKKAH